MKTRHIALIVAFGTLTLFLLSCREPSSPTATPTRPVPNLAEKSPDIRGIVTEVYIQDQSIGGFFVEGKKETDTTYARAYVGVTKDTQFFFRQGSAYVIAAVDDLQVGKTVEVMFVGPVLTSDPIQATALEVVIAH